MVEVFINILCSLFVIIEVRISFVVSPIISTRFSQGKQEKDVSAYVLALYTMIYALMNLGVLCYSGQRLIGSSDKVLDGTYWYDQSLKFQSSLLIVREVATKGLSIKIPGGWILNHETFVNVSSFQFITHKKN
jgi:hypothetical protein